MSELVERLRNPSDTYSVKEMFDLAAARIEELEAERKRDCCAFFRWWWNQPGTNTEDGYDQWLAAAQKEDGDAESHTD